MSDKDPVNVKPENSLSAKLHQAFVDSLPERLGEINQALEAEDYQTLGLLFHGIKGSAGYLKDEALEDMSGQLEVWADEKNMTEVNASFTTFMTHIEPYQT